MLIIKNNKGYSMIELMVVIAIIGIMASAITPQYFGYKKSKSLSYARTQIANDVRYSQDIALSGMKFPGSTIIPRGGYGVYFAKGSSSYIIFGENVTEDKIYTNSNENVETVKLPEGIKISDITVGGTAKTEASYICVPPYGKGMINGTGDAVTLTLSTTDGEMTLAFTLSSSGHIN